MDKIDYVIPTYNSAKDLNKCLENIRKYGNPNRIIIFDKFSTDGTVEIAKKYGCIVFQTNDTLGKVRMKAIQKAETDWFVFIDSDVFIDSGWKKIFQYLNLHNAGVIQATPHNWKWKDEIYCLPYKPKLFGNWRGFTGATLIKKSAVENCDISFCQAFEDWFLQRQVISNGYKWYVVPVKVVHKMGSGIHYSKSLMWHSSALTYYVLNGYLSVSLYLRMVFKFLSWFFVNLKLYSFFWFLAGLFKTRYFNLER